MARWCHRLQDPRLLITVTITIIVLGLLNISVWYEDRRNNINKNENDVNFLRKLENIRDRVLGEDRTFQNNNAKSGDKDESSIEPNSIKETNHIAIPDVNSKTDNIEKDTLQNAIKRNDHLKDIINEIVQKHDLIKTGSIFDTEDRKLLDKHTERKDDLPTNVIQKSPDIKLNKCPPKFMYPKSTFQKFNVVQQLSKYSLNGKNSSSDNFNKTIVILTPISNSVKHLLPYFSLLCWLSYPHELISIVLGEDSSNDNTYQAASAYAKELSPYFKQVSVHHFDTVMQKPDSVKHKHEQSFQLPRRSHMAKSRNQLLSKGVGDSDVVLWVDVDVRYYPHDIIQHLLSENKDVIVPNCMWATGTKITPYDWNNWQETPESMDKLKQLQESQLRVEGYGKDINRKFLHTMKDEGRLVALDGVGGCLLMVKADCHRQGLVFPTFVFRNHIETEGLAKMAKQMGFGVYGMPSMTVVHTYN